MTREEIKKQAKEMREADRRNVNEDFLKAIDITRDELLSTDDAYNTRELKEIVKTYAYAGFMKNLIAVKDYALKQNNQKVYKAVSKILKEGGLI